MKINIDTKYQKLFKRTGEIVHKHRLFISKTNKKIEYSVMDLPIVIDNDTIIYLLHPEYSYLIDIYKKKNIIGTILNKAVAREENDSYRLGYEKGIEVYMYSTLGRKASKNRIMKELALFLAEKMWMQDIRLDEIEDIIDEYNKKIDKSK